MGIMPSEGYTQDNNTAFIAGFLAVPGQDVYVILSLQTLGGTSEQETAAGSGSCRSS